MPDGRQPIRDRRAPMQIEPPAQGATPRPTVAPEHALRRRQPGPVQLAMRRRNLARMPQPKQGPPPAAQGGREPDGREPTAIEDKFSAARRPAADCDGATATGRPP